MFLTRTQQFRTRVIKRRFIDITCIKLGPGIQCTLEYIHRTDRGTNTYVAKKKPNKKQSRIHDQQCIYSHLRRNSLSLSFSLSKVDDIKVVSNRLFNVLSFAYNRCSCRQCKLVLTNKLFAEAVTIHILCKRIMIISLTNHMICLLNILNENKTVISDFLNSIY